MSLKILMDCVITARNPASCSSNMQFLEFARRLLKQRDDVFFYWLVPDWITEEDFKASYPQDPRCRYFHIPQHKDRVLGYIQAPQELLDAVSFKGDYWDFDVLVTMRSGLLPMLRMNMNSPKRPTLGWTQKVILLEEMPMMKFKDTVPNGNSDVSDLFTLSGYLAADKVYIPSFHEKQEIVRSAAKHLPPSQVREIDKKITEVVTTYKNEHSFKTPDQYPSEETGKPFCIAFCNRMEKAFRLKEMNNIMTKKWIMNGNKVRLLVTTVSSTVMEFDTDLVEVVQADRETFWQLQEDMHIGMFMPRGGALSMTLVELMMSGVPMIIIRMPWLERMFKDYPLFVGNETEAYGYVSMFMDDYEGMYAKWQEWMESTFQPLMTKLFENNLLYDKMLADIDQFDKVHDRFREDCVSMKDNSMVKMIHEQAGDRDEFIFEEILKELQDSGKLTMDVHTLAFDKKTRDGRSLIFSFHPNNFRMALKTFYGWEDASTTPGHFKRITA